MSVNKLGQEGLSELFHEKLVWFAGPGSGAPTPCDDSGRERLFAGLRACECSLKPDPFRVAGFNIDKIDAALSTGGLKYGAVHEWFSGTVREAYSPLIIPVCLIAGNFKSGAAPSGGYIFWIGRKAWPSPFLLEQAGGGDFLSRCVFLDPADDKSLLWAIETALRCGAVSCVVAALKTLRFSTSRRFELAARNGNTLGFLLRSERGLKDNSAAATRWLVRPQPSPDSNPRFELGLLRQKGSGAAPLYWTVEFYTDEDGHKKVSLRIPSSMGSESEAEILRKCAG